METLLTALPDIALFVCTWPYYRTLHQYTINPIRAIVTCHDDNTLVKHVVQWRAGKENEMQFVKTASTVSAGATVAVFTWTSINTCTWIARALWYCSLSLSIWALIQSTQQENLLRSLPLVSSSGMVSQEDLNLVIEAILHRSKAQRDARHPSARMNGLGFTHFAMLYAWQAPMMFMSYGWTAFLIALTLYVCTPMINGDPWGDDMKVCIAYLIVGGAAFLSFAICSFFTYQRSSLHFQPSSAMQEITEASGQRSSSESLNLSGTGSTDNAITQRKAKTSSRSSLNQHAKGHQEASQPTTDNST